MLNEEESTFDREEKRSALEIDEVTVVIPGLKSDYKLIFISDMHIIVESEEINVDMLETVRQRYEDYKNELGVSSSKLWPQIADTLDSYQADAVLLGGDMIDYASKSNIDCLLDGIRKIQTPVMYIRADDDLATWYNDLEDDYVDSLHKKIDSNEEVFSIDLKEFLIVGVNNNTSQISKTALEKLKEYFSKNYQLF